MINKPDLPQLYKEHSRHSHEHALEMIFEEGVKYQETLDKDKLKVASEKHEAILENISLSEDEVQRTAVKQTLGMGNVFK